MSAPSSSGSNIGLSDSAQQLHTKMAAEAVGSLFDQAQLQVMANVNALSDLMLIVQELLNKNLIKLIKQGDDLKFQAVSQQEAIKKATMSQDESLVYSYIEASGREGIWTKTIKARTNLHQHVVLRCLKSLEQQRYIKSVKSVKFPTRKIYMLYDLQPSLDVSGGAWFTDGELDLEFINSLLLVVWRFVSTHSFPQGSKELLYTSSVQNYVSTDEILTFIQNARISTVDLSAQDVKSLCQVLIYDGRLEEVTHEMYRVTLSSIQEMADETAEAKEGEYSVFQWKNMISASQDDAEAVWFDEWSL